MKGKMQKFVVWHPQLGYVFKQSTSFNWSDQPEPRAMFSRKKDAENFIEKLKNSWTIQQKINYDNINKFEVFKVTLTWNIE